jgi:hypothetical protein
MEPQHFGKLDPGYPLYREKPNPDSQSSQKADPVPHQSKKLGSAKAQHGALEPRKVCRPVCGRFASFSWGAGSGSSK